MKVRFAFGTFRPVKPLLFSNNKVLIYSNPALQKKAYLGQTLAYGSTAFFGFRVLFAASGMGWLSWLFQSGLFLGSTVLSSRAFFVSRILATEIYLKSDGKTLEVHTGFLRDYFKSQEIRIEDISQESHLGKNLKFLSGQFKTILTKDEDLILLWMDGIVSDKELLDNVLEGNVVEVEGKVDVIDI